MLASKGTETTAAFGGASSRPSLTRRSWLSLALAAATTGCSPAIEPPVATLLAALESGDHAKLMSAATDDLAKDMDAESFAQVVAAYAMLGARQDIARVAQRERDGAKTVEYAVTYANMPARLTVNLKGDRIASFELDDGAWRAAQKRLHIARLEALLDAVERGDGDALTKLWSPKAQPVALDPLGAAIADLGARKHVESVGDDLDTYEVTYEKGAVDATIRLRGGAIAVVALRPRR